MNIDNFNYELPNKLIAQYPPKIRGDSKLLVANPVSESLQDLSFSNFITYTELALNLSITTKVYKS